ncbi:MAG: hypothetical protein ACOCTT_02650, partial [archaeon]
MNSNEENLQNLKIKQEVMSEQIKNVCDNQNGLKKDVSNLSDQLRSYIKEDRDWKENFPSRMDKRYATKDELKHVKYLTYLLISAVSFFISWVAYT